MARRIESALAEPAAQSWESVRDQIKSDFAAKSHVLYNRSQCQYPDGSDLLAQAVWGLADGIRNETVHKMRDALNAAASNHFSRMTWNHIRESTLNENRLAIGALREIGEISDNGAGLIDEALRQTDLRIVVRSDIDTLGRPVEYLAGPQVKALEKPECEESNEGNESGKPKNGGPSLLTILRWVAGLLSIAAAIAALAGVTVWDIFPIPCDLPIFSLLPRC